MNFYKRHLGDMAKSCGHLSQGEQGAYDLLLDWHYGNEKPIPADPATYQRIARARSIAERKNADRVVEQFFVKTPEGYIQKRAGEEMAKANAQAETNQRIAREREEARRARIDHESLTSSSNESSNGSSTNREPSQTPDSRLQEAGSFLGDPNKTPPPVAALAGQNPVDNSGDRTGQFEGHEQPFTPATSPIAPFAIAMRRLGFDTTSLNPELIAYVGAGGTLEHLTETCNRSDCRGKVANYVLAIARRELAETASPVQVNGTPRPIQPPHNPGGVSPRLSVEDEAKRNIEALELMRLSDPETYATLTGRDATVPYAPSIAA